MNGEDQNLRFSCISLAVQAGHNGDRDVIEMAQRIYDFVRGETAPASTKNLTGEPSAAHGRQGKTLAQWAGLADEAPAA